MLLFERDGRQHPVPDRLACGVVEHLNVVEHIRSGLNAGLVGSSFCRLLFEQIEKALGNGVIIRVSPSVRPIWWLNYESTIASGNENMQRSVAKDFGKPDMLELGNP